MMINNGGDTGGGRGGDFKGRGFLLSVYFLRESLFGQFIMYAIL